MREKAFKIDLAEIDGGPDFPCPKCGNLISPDDHSEEAYKIIDTVMGDEDLFERVVIQCNRCNSIITLEGFKTFYEEALLRVEISEALNESKPGYRTHHAIRLEGKKIGHIAVEYAQSEDVKAFKKIRRLRLGEAFKASVTIDGSEVSELGREDLAEIGEALKRRFKGLRDSDIYFVEVEDGRRKILGRASDL